MVYVNSDKEPELVFVGTDDLEISKIQKWVQKLNADLIDSGFEQYQYDIEVQADKAYIKRV